MSAGYCPGCGRADMAGITHVCPAPDVWFTPEPGCGVSPCFMPCGDAACKTLGCVRVYNARARVAGVSSSTGTPGEHLGDGQRPSSEGSNA